MKVFLKNGQNVEIRIEAEYIRDLYFIGDLTWRAYDDNNESISVMMKDIDIQATLANKKNAG